MTNRTSVAASRSALLGASGLSIPAGGTVETRGFLTEGDGGGGLYTEVSAPATELQANKGYIHIPGDRWFKLVSERGEVFLDQFGGSADYSGSGSGGTDNLQPLRDAMEFDAFASGANNYHSHKIQLGLGRRWFSDTFVVDRIACICGVGSRYEGMGQGVGTQLWFPANKDGILVQWWNGTGRDVIGGGNNKGGAGSVLDGFGIHFLTGTDTTRSAVFVRAACTLRDLSVYNACGTGFTIRAGDGNGGNANGTVVSDCYVHSALMHGIETAGVDANACVITNFQTHGGVGGCGIYEHSGLGNLYYMSNIEGYGNRGVHKDGIIYQLITPGATGAQVPGAAPNYWYAFGPGGPSAYAPEWDNSKTYGASDLCAPIYCAGDSNRSIFFGTYIEDGLTAGHLSGPSAAYPGYGRFTPLSTAIYSGVVSNQGFGGFRGFKVNDPGYAKHGNAVAAYVGALVSSGGADYAYDMDLLCFLNAKSDKMICAYGSEGTAIEFHWFNNPVIMRLHSHVNTINYDRNAGPTNIVGLRDVLLNEPSGGIGGSIIVGVRYAQPTDPGEYKRGDKYFNGNPSPGGTEGWVCTTSGVIPSSGTWVTGTTYSGGEIVVTSAGRYYRNKVWGLSTIEPTHTSGTVTLSDGREWAYLGNSAPVFKQFGSIAS